MKKTGFILLAAIIALTLSILGCDKKTTNYYGGGAATGGDMPMGTIQGYLIDSVTQDPIAGAVIDIGVAKTTTAADGQYVIENVPTNLESIITTPVAAAGTAGNQTVTTTYTGSYYMTIDLRNVTSPVAMTSTATPRYPDFSYDTVTAQYQIISNIDTSGSGSIGSTPLTVTQKVTNKMLSVGKLAANIAGVVAYGSSTPGGLALQPVGSGWTVKLVSNGSSDSEGSTGGTGAASNVVQTATTGANGDFTFSNIESLQNFTIQAWNASGTYSNGTGVTVSAPADGETKQLAVQTNDAIFVVATDSLSPAIIAVSPENNADITSTGGANVVFTFSEPILQDAYATVLSNNAAFGTANGLYNDVAVNFNGVKAGNIAHTLSWDSTRTILTVAIPTLAPSSKYTVDIHLAALMDDAGKCVDTDADNTCDIAQAADSGARNNIVNFTTNGGATAAAPSVVLTDSASLDQADTTNFTNIPCLDWLPVSGAKFYNVYRTRNEVWGATVNTGAAQLMTASAISASGWCDAAVTFVEHDQVKLTYDYTVKSVNSEGTESDGSTAVNAKDVIGANLANTGSFVGQINDSDDQITIYFNEQLDEATAETAANYSLTGISGTVPTIASAVYNGWDAVNSRSSVTLTLSADLNPSNITRSYISTGVDGILSTTVIANDGALFPADSGGLCISPVGTGDTSGTALTTAVGGDDVIFKPADAPTAMANSIYAGPDGVCNSTAAAADTQVVAATAKPAANALGITAATYTNGAIDNAAADFTLQTVTLNGVALTGITGTPDDVVVRTVLVTVSTNVHDVAGNALNTGRAAGIITNGASTTGAFTKLNTDGTTLP